MDYNSFFCRLCECRIFINEINEHFTEHPGHQEKRCMIRRPDCQVFVWWRYEMGITPWDILELFRQHGPVIDIMLHTDLSCFVSTEEPEFVTWLLRWAPPLYHRDMPLSIWAVPAVFIPPDSPEKYLNSSQLEAHLVNQKNVEFQIDSFLRWTKVPLAEELLQLKALDDMRVGLFIYLPQSKLSVYGSSSTGLQLPGSDLDLSLTLDVNLPLVGPLNQETKIDKKAMSNFMTYLKNGKPIPARELSMESLMTQLGVLRKILNRTVPGICGTMIIPSKACPILRFVIRNKLSCDLKLNSGLEMENSRLIWLYTRMDPRVRPMVLIVKYWARQHGLLGSTALSSYALTWMVLVFLQSEQTLALPSVLECRRLLGESKPKMIKGYDCSFSDNLHHYKGRNTFYQLQSLLSDFFKFYSRLDFKNTVISPVLGRCLPTAEFLSCHCSTFNTHFINIQDPLEVDRNLGLRCAPKVYVQLLAVLPKAVKAIEMSSGKLLWGLAQLFHPIPKLGNLPLPPEAQLQEFDVDIELCTKPEVHKDRYFLAACKLVHRFLTEVLRAVVSVVLNNITEHPVGSEPQFDKQSIPIASSKIRVSVIGEVSPETQQGAASGQSLESPSSNSKNSGALSASSGTPNSEATSSQQSQVARQGSDSFIAPQSQQSQVVKQGSDSIIAPQSRQGQVAKQGSDSIIAPQSQQSQVAKQGSDSIIAPQSQRIEESTNLELPNPDLPSTHSSIQDSSLASSLVPDNLDNSKTSQEQNRKTEQSSDQNVPDSDAQMPSEDPTPSAVGSENPLQQSRGTKRSLDQDEEDNPLQKKSCHTALQVSRRLPKKSPGGQSAIRFYQVKISHRLWLNRPETFKPEDKATLLQDEASVSLQMLEDMEKLPVHPPGSFHLRLYGKESKDPCPRLKITLKPPQQLQDPKMVDFLKKKLGVLLTDITPI